MSESDKPLRKRLKSLYKPEILSSNCHKFKGIRQLIHIYGSGFPCQPFSAIGKRKGSKDKRSNVAKAVVRRIRRWLPDTFILENVKGLTYKKNLKFFRRLLRLLSADGHYDVQWKVMDSLGYAGLPQRRERLWIVGTNKYATRRKFKFPSPLPWAGKVRLSEFLGRKRKRCRFPRTMSGRKRLVDGLEYIRDEDGDTKECWVVDCAASKKFQGNPSYEVSPCLTRARGGGDSFWITSHGRYMNLQEKAILQGWSSVDPGDLTASQLGAALGNAWSLPLAARIVYQLNRSMDWSNDAVDPLMKK